jgi:hypothetical protein
VLFLVTCCCLYSLLDESKENYRLSKLHPLVANCLHWLCVFIFTRTYFVFFLIDHQSCFLTVLSNTSNYSSKVFTFLDIMTTSFAYVLLWTIAVDIFPLISNYFIIWSCTKLNKMTDNASPRLSPTLALKHPIMLSSITTFPWKSSSVILNNLGISFSSILLSLCL